MTVYIVDDNIMRVCLEWYKVIPYVDDVGFANQAVFWGSLVCD